MPNLQDDDEDILGRPEDAEELPPEIAQQLMPHSVAGSPYAGVAQAATASRPQPKSIAGPAPTPAPSVTEVPRGTLDTPTAMPATSGPLDMPTASPSVPRPVGPAEQRLSSLTAQGAPPVTPLHGWKKALDIAGQAFTPYLEQDIRYAPQNAYEKNLANAKTDYAAENEPNKQTLADETTARQNALSGAQETELGARAENEKSEAEHRGDTPAKADEWTMVPDTNWEINKTTGETKQATGIPERTKIEKPDTIEMGNRTFQWDADKKKWSDIGPAKATEGGEGTWQIAEDENGKAILFNSKTAQTRPAPPGIKPKSTDAGPGGAFDRASAEAASKDVETARGGDFRYRSMAGSLPAAQKGDQQAMLNLLTNHIGMTLGMQKGARITKDILREAQESTPWLQGLEAKWDKDGYLSGAVLTKPQMGQMMHLAEQQRANSWAQAIESARQGGVADKLKIPANVRIVVAGPDGKLSTLPAAQLSQAEDQGYTVAPQ